MTKEEAISILKRKSTIPDDDYCWDEIEEAFNMAIEALENQKTGHWIRQETIYGLAETCECSECGRTIYASNDEDLVDFPYCHCGAKMEGE